MKNERTAEDGLVGDSIMLTVVWPSGTSVLKDFAVLTSTTVASFLTQVVRASGRNVGALLSSAKARLDLDATIASCGLRDNDVVTALALPPNTFSTRGAFAAMRSDGSVVTWGNPHFGGDSGDVQEQLVGGIQHIYATASAFAAVKTGGSAVTWGNPADGGDSGDVQEQLAGGIQHIYATRRAFAAVKTDGSVVTWGDPFFGGDTGGVREQLAGGIQHIYATALAFAAMKTDGSVVTWGHPDYGGDSAEVQEQLHGGIQHRYAT